MALPKKFKFAPLTNQKNTLIRHKSLTTILVLLFMGQPLSQDLIAETLSKWTDNLSLDGRVQPRYEFTDSSGTKENNSSFYLRRVRLNVTGEVTESVSFRFMPELAREASMRDVWVNIAFSDQAQLRMGQFPLPFHWHRYVSSSMQHFVERGVPSLQLAYPTGYDKGLMLHGKASNESFEYEVGVFDGGGRNTKFSPSDGHVFSGRLTSAIIGELPNSEGEIYRSEFPNLALAGGIQGGNKNEGRDWDLQNIGGGHERADFLSFTADFHFQYQGFSLASDFYQRFVDPEDPAIDAFEGRGYMVTAGITILPGALEAVGRFSELHLDNDLSDSHRQEWGGGLNIYHDDHDLKTHVQYLRDGQAGPQVEGFEWTGSFIVQHHILF